MPTLSSELQDTVLRIFGVAGRDWIDRFPEILRQCQAHWELTEITPFPDLSINYVAHAVRPGGVPVVLKIGVPHREFSTEIAALLRYNGHRIVRCLAADQQLCAILLERLSPGTMLTAIADNARATTIAADLMRTLPIPYPEPHDFPTFAEWIARAFKRYRDTYGAAGGPLGCDLLADAERYFTLIREATTRVVLLHGDLHHQNILFDDQRGWTAIDPKGVIGPPCLEAGRFLHNQLPETLPLTEIDRKLAARVEIISATLDESPTRIWQSALIDKVLSLCWSLEDEWFAGNWEHELAVIRVLSMRIKQCIKPE